MKIKIAENQNYAAFLITGRKDSKLEFTPKNGTGTLMLGPNELIPGLDGIPAWNLVMAHTVTMGGVKPGQRAAIDKFIAAGRPGEVKIDAEKSKELDWVNELGGLACELNEAAAALELIMSSDTITGAGGTAEDFDTLRQAMWHLAPSIIENSKKLYRLMDSQPGLMSGK